MWDGLWDFWNSLKEQYNALKVLDTLIIKPAILTLYVSALPEIAILKTSQAIGTGLKEYGNSKNLWDSLKVGADKAFTSATKHFLYLSQIDSTHILIDDFKRYVKKTSPELTQAVTNICKDCNKMENLRSLLIKIESSTEIKDPAIQKTLVNTANRYFVEHTIEADYKKQTRMPKSKESFQSKHASHQNPQTSLKNTQITSSNIKLQS
ncbi:MAG UNVERIFIED_CONTAM: hypothetical protein LVQ98_02340 [Rickettsiaceae bacterium]